MDTSDLNCVICEITKKTFEVIKKVYDHHNEYVDSQKKLKTTKDMTSSDVGSRIIFPQYHIHKKEKEKRKDYNRISEQELRFIFVEQLNKYADQNNIDIYYSVEAPTKNAYIFSSENNDAPKVDNENAKEYLNTLEGLVKDNSFNLKYKTGIKEDGYCNFQDKEIVINSNQTNLVKFKTLLHEFAHSLAHTNLEKNYKEYQNNRNKYETEAESIAYVVSNYFNLNVPEFSETYLYSWSRNKDFKEIDSSLETICNYSQMIINKINDKMKNKDLDYSIQNSNEVAI